MKLNPVHARRERHERELVEVEAFRTVRRAADQELRELESRARGSHEVAAARAALEGAGTAEEVVAVEPLVRQAAHELGVDRPEGQVLRIADRLLSWADVGGSYAGVVAASRGTQAGTSPDQRSRDMKNAQWSDQARGWEKA